MSGVNLATNLDLLWWRPGDSPRKIWAPWVLPTNPACPGETVLSVGSWYDARPPPWGEEDSSPLRYLFLFQFPVECPYGKSMFAFLAESCRLVWFDSSISLGHVANWCVGRMSTLCGISLQFFVVLGASEAHPSDERSICFQLALFCLTHVLFSKFPECGWSFLSHAAFLAFFLS